MVYDSKYLDILTYKESDRPLLDIWYSSYVHYPYRTKTKWSGFEFTGFKIELVVFRYVIHLDLKFGNTYVGPKEAERRFKQRQKELTK
jgi:hypothetical protein